MKTPGPRCWDHRQRGWATLLLKSTACPGQDEQDKEAAGHRHGLPVRARTVRGEGRQDHPHLHHPVHHDQQEHDELAVYALWCTSADYTDSLNDKTERPGKAGAARQRRQREAVERHEAGHRDAAAQSTAWRQLTMTLKH